MQEFNSADSWFDAIQASTKLPEGFRLSTSSLDFLPKERPSSNPYTMRLSLIAAEKPSSAFAGVFTRNAFPGAPVTIGKEILRSNYAQAILVNNKVSNVGGPNAYQDAKTVCAALGEKLGYETDHIFPASTGIIGWSLPVPEMIRALPNLCGGVGTFGPADIARSIMTTDRYPKAFSANVGGGRILGIAKGAGMIEPNLATMLVFIITDLDQPRNEMQEALKRVAEKTFNSISVDSDQSTSDMCLLISSQRKSRVPAPDFEGALLGLCRTIAGHIVRNGEGCSHVLKVRVDGLGDDAICREAGKAIINSPLVKTAIYGNDPNVGRILSALGDYMGNRGLSFPHQRLCLDICGLTVFRDGAFQLDVQLENALSEALRHAQQDPHAAGYPQHQRFVDIHVRLDERRGRRGDAASSAAELPMGSAEVIGSDLGYEYVKENADYRT